MKKKKRKTRQRDYRPSPKSLKCLFLQSIDNNITFIRVPNMDILFQLHYGTHTHTHTHTEREREREREKVSPSSSIPSISSFYYYIDQQAKVRGKKGKKKKARE